jgi:hypothetical protein
MDQFRHWKSSMLLLPSRDLDDEKAVLEAKKY